MKDARSGGPEGVAMTTPPAISPRSLMAAIRISVTRSFGDPRSKTRHCAAAAAMGAQSAKVVRPHAKAFILPLLECREESFHSARVAAVARGRSAVRRAPREAEFT